MEILCSLRLVNLVKDKRIGIVFSCRDLKRFKTRLEARTIITVGIGVCFPHFPV
jgi:hypothetical protein